MVHTAPRLGWGWMLDSLPIPLDNVVAIAHCIPWLWKVLPTPPQIPEPREAADDGHDVLQRVGGLPTIHSQRPKSRMSLRMSYSFPWLLTHTLRVVDD